MEQKKLLNLSEQGFNLSTSGTTGTPKVFYQSPDKIRAANKVAVDAQEISSKSKIYTVSKMSHAGGLLAQTLPALSVGADVVIEEFNPYRFVKEIYKYTHSHLAPGHAKAIIGTKGFNDIDLKGVWITCGSDPVSWDIIEKFVSKGAIFMANWGMTEIGPIAINITFRNLDEVYTAKERSINGSILGNIFYCDYKIENNELIVSGDISVFNDWYSTGDLVAKNTYGDLYYRGRTNKGFIL